jgi:hypothetical protein
MSIIDKLTRAPLKQQTTTMNTSPAPDRPLWGLALELRWIVFGYLVPSLLALYLLNRDREWSPSIGTVGTRLGLDRSRWRFDVVAGFGLAAVIGLPGLGLYLAAREIGINTSVSAANLSEWWAIPVLVLLAFGNGLIEEVVVVGYLVTRLRQTGWGVAAAVTASSPLPGLRRLPGQRHHGRRLHTLLPAYRKALAAGHRARHPRHRRVCGLHPAARPRHVAVSTLAGISVRGTW